MVVSSLKPGIVMMIKDMNGNHVAQRCLSYLLPEYSEVMDIYSLQFAYYIWDFHLICLICWVLIMCSI